MIARIKCALGGHDLDLVQCFVATPVQGPAFAPMPERILLRRCRRCPAYTRP